MHARRLEAETNAIPEIYVQDNAHNELHAFHTGKSDLLKKMLRLMGGGLLPPLRPPPELATV